MPDSAWATWFQTLAGAAGGLLGLGTVAVTLLYTVTSSARLELVRAQLGGRLQRLFISCMRALLAGLGVFCLLYAVDVTKHPSFRDASLAAALAVCGLRAIRMFWLFARVVMVLASTGDTPSASTSSSPAGPWRRPPVSEHDYGRPERLP